MAENIKEQLIVSQGISDYFQGSTDLDANLEKLKAKIRELLNLKNVHFLFGSGTSCGAIPTMKGLFEQLTFNDDEADLEAEFKCIKDKCGNNLEECLNVMYSAQYYYSRLGAKELKLKRNIKISLLKYNKLIEKVQKHIFDSINIEFGSDKANKVLEYYKTFYQKLALRNKDNSRIRVFTTNNDLFNETALDSLNIHYINGFSGGLKRFFNPALFNYTWSKRMDTSIDKYEPVENMVYLYKIHGSINWKQTSSLSNNFFDIEEISTPNNEHGAILIYPTPTKQEKSLGSPYLDLFREFQTKLLEPHSVLFVIGYSFSDCHVNDIIYRALATNSTINVVIFGEKPNEIERDKKPIFFIDDKRVFIINGKLKDADELKTVHHFEYIVNNLLPDLDTFSQEDNLLKSFVEKLKAETNR